MIKRFNKGFTLIEIMVALAVLSVTMTSSYTVYQSLTSSVTQQVKGVDTLQQMRSLQKKLSDEIRKTGYRVSSDSLIPQATPTLGIQQVQLQPPAGSYGQASLTSVGTPIAIVNVPLVTTTFTENTQQLTDLSGLFSGGSGTVTYEVLSQQDFWAFGVIGDDLVATSSLDFENSFDFDSDRVYDIRIRATDSQGSAQESDLAITITNLAPEAAQTTGAHTLVNQQNTDGLVLTKGSTAIRSNETTHFKISGLADGLGLFLADGTSAIVEGSHVTIAQGLAGLKVRPTVNP